MKRGLMTNNNCVDLAAAVKTSEHATAMLNEPTAKAGAKRSAVRTAILLSRPTAL